MPINNLIANPYVASPVTNYLAGQRNAQRTQMNDLAMSNSNQVMQARGQTMTDAAEMRKLQTVATYMKGAKPEDYKARAEKLFKDHGYKSPEHYNENDINTLLERAGMRDKAAKADSFTLGQGQKRFDATGNEIASVAPKKSTALVNNTVVNSPGDDKYWEERLKAQAKNQDGLANRAEASFNEMKALDRFLESSKDSTTGGAQPIINGIQNFLTSFGAEFEGLTDIAQMEQAIGDIKVNFFKEFGARGLTDKDMEIIKDSLPRISTSQDARENVVRILKKTHAKSIEGYEHSLDEERRVYPERADKVFTKDWYNDYVNYSQEGDDLTAEEKAELSARESIYNQVPRTN